MIDQMPMSASDEIFSIYELKKFLEGQGIHDGAKRGFDGVITRNKKKAGINVA